MEKECMMSHISKPYRKNMQFTYHAYKDLIKRLRSKEYELVGYTDYKGKDKCAILRHDVDTSIDKALQLATLEYQEDVKSTYFFLLNTDFYNIASQSSIEKIQRIHDMNHEIGLHFDETKYTDFTLGGGDRPYYRRSKYYAIDSETPCSCGLHAPPYKSHIGS